jgi:hypothetical protein
VRVTVPRCAIARRYGACVRWGPVVASILAAVALVAAAFTGIVVTADGATTRFGVVRLEGLVGETLLLVAVLLPVMTALFARRLASFGVVLGLGVASLVAIFLARLSLTTDADSVLDFIASQGDAGGADSVLVRAVEGTVTDVSVGTAASLLASAGALALVALGWVGWVELAGRRRPASADATADGSVTNSSHVPHT